MLLHDNWQLVEVLKYNMKTVEETRTTKTSRPWSRVKIPESKRPGGCCFMEIIL